MRKFNTSLFASIVGVTEGYIRLKFLLRGINPATRYRARLLELNYTETEIGEWRIFFEKRIPAKFRQKSNGKPKKRRSNPIKYEFNIELTPVQRAKIAELSQLKRERILSLFSIIEKIQKTGDFSARNMQKIIEKDMSNNKTTLRSVRINIKKIKEKGVDAFIETWQNYGSANLGKTKIAAADLDFFTTTFANDNYLSTKMAYKLTVGKAIEENRFDADKFPCAASFLYWIKKTLGEEELDRIRKGEDFHTRNHAAYVRKTAADLRPMQCLVGDCMDSDVFVKVPTAKVYQFDPEFRFENESDKHKDYQPMRLKLTAWMDYKTHRIVGWLLHSRAQNTDHILISLKSAIAKYGCPETLLVDNGKTYANKELGTNGKQQRKLKFGIDLNRENRRKLEGIFEKLGLPVKFTLPFNSDGKPIERMFGIVHQEYDKLFFGQYAGVTKLRRPESTDDTTLRGKNHDLVKTLEEFTEMFDNFVENIYNKRVFETGERAGMSPLHLWNEEYREDSVRHFGEGTLALLLSRQTQPKTVQRHQIYYKNYNCYYYSPMFKNRQKLYLRIDPTAAEVAYCYDENDKYICTAQQTPVVSALAQTEHDRAALAAAMKIANESKKRTNAKISAVKTLAKNTDLSPETLLKYSQNYTEYKAKEYGLNHNEIKTEIEKELTRTTYDDDLREAKRQENEGTKLPAIAVGQDFCPPKKPELRRY